jgi:hypothetical protein
LSTYWSSEEEEMGRQSETLTKFIKSKQLVIFLVLMAIASVLFYPILTRKQRKWLELQEKIKESNKDRATSFGGSSLDRVE